MSQNLSRFPPNSRLGNTDNTYVGHMCYGPMHLDLSESKASVADWVGTGRSILPGDYVSIVTFKDGTSTLMCKGCGVSAVGAAVGDLEPEKGDRIAGDVTREEMETAGIHEDYRNTFREATSLTSGAVAPNGELYRSITETPVFEVDRDSFTDKASFVSGYKKYDARKEMAEAMAAQYVRNTSKHDA
ncbi:hypothetical protein B9479_007691 [Cryptococcus floricola]|uniref:Uncharacterized protein n=1 Tax=Cryptococcus floricola TaxID=2591691 RepID=A0A5D3APX7_9TREE|nr:hypothetical protein B9479_007691 [Cryptococcus floricola]